MARRAFTSETHLRSSGLRFITCSCYKREPLLGSGRSRDLFLDIFEQVRRKYWFEVVGYVVMPEHFHGLIGEPEIGTPSTVLQVLKQRVGQRLLPPRHKNQNQLGLWRENGKQKKRHFFQPRFYDFNVYTRKKMIEKLRHMHRNPSGSPTNPGVAVVGVIVQ